MNIYIYILINIGLGHLAWDMVWACGPMGPDPGPGEAPPVWPQVFRKELERPSQESLCRSSSLFRRSSSEIMWTRLSSFASFRRSSSLFDRSSSLAVQARSLNGKCVFWKRAWTAVVIRPLKLFSDRSSSEVDRSSSVSPFKLAAVQARRVFFAESYFL